MELCTRYPRIECRQAQWNACEIQHELLLLGKYHFIAVTACDNAQSWHPPPILRKSREICENIRIFPPEALQNQFIKATTRFAPSNHTTNFECSHTMEIDIDLPFKPVTTSYNSTPFISSPSSKKKRKLSTSSPTNNPRTTKRKGNEFEPSSISAPPLQPISHPAPDIIMATETLHMHDTSMRDSTSFIDNDKKSKQRKIRFTMGPRADCPKCKLGVKGHYSHFD